MGELAQAAGLTVRTLHHYDRLGLLVPSERSTAGYRLYSEADVRRLFRIVALRRLGLSLQAIASALESEGPDLATIVTRQLEAVERQQHDLTQLRRRLLEIREVLMRGHEPSLDQLTTTMESMSMHEKYLSPDQLERLRRRGAELGREAIEDAQREWDELFATLRAEMEAGTDPADPKLDSYHERARALLRAFTGGETDIEQAMRRMWTHEDPATISRGVVDQDLWDYGEKVAQARGGISSS